MDIKIDMHISSFIILKLPIYLCMYFSINLRSYVKVKSIEIHIVLRNLYEEAV